MALNTTGHDPELNPRPRAWLALLFVGLGAACAKGFYDIAASYGDFMLPQSGIIGLPEPELVFYAWYALFGGLIGLCAIGLLRELGSEVRLRRVSEAAASEPRRLVFALSLLAFVGSLLFRRLILEGQAIADDEATYLFIARTLLAGRLSNPPPQDPEFFRNQFVVLNDHAWHGKYPIGHPLWLAIGEAIGLRDAMPALACALCVALTFAIGSRWFSARVALFGIALLVLSPHFLWTFGTLLSQPTSCLLMLSGVWGSLRAAESLGGAPAADNAPRSSAGSALAWAVLAGVSFGLGVLARPLPGALFAALGAAWWTVRLIRPELVPDASAARARWLRAWLLFGASSALVAGLFLVVNYVQNGSPFASGHAEVHGSVRVFANDKSRIANSLFGGLLRENFWLLGVPGSLLPLLLCRPLRERALFWGLITAELSYRAIAPKTVVGTTGPIYLTEIVPLLALGAADGLARGARFAARRAGALTLAAAGAITAFCLFWPVELQTIRRGVEMRSLVFRALEAKQAERALVFSDALVFPQSGFSWAYYPENPSPELDDDILFVRIPERDPMRELQAFWQRRFPDRRAFLFMWSPKGEPLFRELARGEP